MWTRRCCFAKPHLPNRQIFMKRYVNHKRIGMLTPSNNTVLEPYTSRLFMPFMETVSVHFSRFKVTGTSLSPPSMQPFDHDAILEAAHRLAEARVDCIAWNGTCAAWLGMEQDQLLCARITEETGIRTTSTMAAFAEAIDYAGAKRLALITPYTSDIQDAIIARYQSAGHEIVHDTRLEDSGNFSFAEHATEEIKGYAMQAAESKPDAILTLCTNFRGAPIAAEVEACSGILVIDSVSITAWKTLRLVGEDPSEIMGWGSVFALGSRQHLQHPGTDAGSLAPDTRVHFVA